MNYPEHYTQSHQHLLVQGGLNTSFYRSSSNIYPVDEPELGQRSTQYIVAATKTETVSKIQKLLLCKN